jgi:hypothetical protein
MARFPPAEIEQLIVWERLHLYNRGLPCGALAIRHRLDRQGVGELPSVRSIHRILSRNGLTHRRTGFYPESDPPYNATSPGWFIVIKNHRIPPLFLLITPVLWLFPVALFR